MNNLNKVPNTLADDGMGNSLDDSHLTMHPRMLIRHALVRVLRENSAVASLMPGGIFPNRAEHWLADELPACGLYTLSEDTLESDISPDPQERRIDLACEIVCALTENIDDRLDALALAVEKALDLNLVGEAMGAIVDEAREKKGLPPLGRGQVNGVSRHLADTLLLLHLKSTGLGIAVDGDRQIGVAVLNFDLEYATPVQCLPLPDFLLAASGWDVQPADGNIDMKSVVEFPAEDEA